jgi:uncharacterized protein (TIGR00369 family)
MTAAVSFPVPSSPSAALLGWHLLAHDAAKGWVRIGFEARREFLNPAGFVQGGFLTAMLDDCMGPAAWIMTHGALYTATIDMTVSFLAPAKPGPLIGEGQVVQLGKTIAFLEARLRRRCSDGGSRHCQCPTCSSQARRGSHWHAGAGLWLKRNPSKENNRERPN